MPSIPMSKVFCPVCNDTPSSIMIAEKGVILETRLTLSGSDYEAAGSHKTYEKRHSKVLRCGDCGEEIRNDHTDKNHPGIDVYLDSFQFAI